MDMKEYIRSQIKFTTYKDVWTAMYRGRCIAKNINRDKVKTEAAKFVNEMITDLEKAIQCY